MPSYVINSNFTTNQVELIQQRNPQLFTLDEKYLNQMSKRKLKDVEIADVATLLFNRKQAGENVTGLADKFLDICIKHKYTSSSVLEFDLKIHTDTGEFKIKTTKEAFNRWKKWGFEPSIFAQYNKFARFLLESPLGSQMKIFHNTIEIRNGVPGILVEGEWKSHEEVMNQFEVKFSPEFREKFMFNKETQEVFTYLGNGQGLQKHHPYTETLLNHPITRLTDEEYERVLASGQTFVRQGEEGLPVNKERTFVYQIVSSYIDGPNLNVSEFIYKRKHPWIRVICGRDNPEFGTKKGDVFEVGFNWGEKPGLPGKTGKGRFRTEDFWNYNSQAKERVVTNIAITPEEAQKMFKYISEYHKTNLDPQDSKQKLAFNLAAQNCSAFVHYSSVVLPGVNAPTKLYLTDLIQEISPDWMKMIGRTYLAGRRKAGNILKTVTSWIPSIISNTFSHTVYKIRQGVLATFSFFAVIPLKLVSCLLGGAHGEEGRAFNRDVNKPKTLGARLSSLRHRFGLKFFYYHAPGALQGWQRQQPSTVIYKNPTKLAVVPPPA